MRVRSAATRDMSASSSLLAKPAVALGNSSRVGLSGDVEGGAAGTGAVRDAAAGGSALGAAGGAGCPTRALCAGAGSRSGGPGWAAAGPGSSAAHAMDRAKAKRRAMDTLP